MKPNVARLLIPTTPLRLAARSFCFFSILILCPLPGCRGTFPFTINVNMGVTHQKWIEFEGGRGRWKSQPAACLTADVCFEYCVDGSSEGDVRWIQECRKIQTNAGGRAQFQIVGAIDGKYCGAKTNLFYPDRFVGSEYRGNISLEQIDTSDSGDFSWVLDWPHGNVVGTEETGANFTGNVDLRFDLRQAIRPDTEPRCDQVR